MSKRQELGHDVLNESSKRRSPEKAMEEIQKQETHNLYCPKCTRNITKTAQLFEKGDELSPDNQKSLVLWVPLFIPFKFLSTLTCCTTNLTAENNSTNTNPNPNPNPNGPVENNSFHPNSSGSVDNNSSNRNRLAKMLERLPTLFPKSAVSTEENIVTNKEKDNSTTPLDQEGAGHQNSTSTSGKMKTRGIYAESEQHRHVANYDDGWKYHHH